jgi:hypothetical protein
MTVQSRRISATFSIFKMNQMWELFVTVKRATPSFHLHNRDRIYLLHRIRKGHKISMEFSPTAILEKLIEFSGVSMVWESANVMNDCFYFDRKLNFLGKNPENKIPNDWRDVLN